MDSPVFFFTTVISLLLFVIFVGYMHSRYERKERIKSLDTQLSLAGSSFKEELRLCSTISLSHKSEQLIIAHADKIYTPEDVSSLHPRVSSYYKSDSVTYSLSLSMKDGFSCDIPVTSLKEFLVVVSELSIFCKRSLVDGLGELDKGFIDSASNSLDKMIDGSKKESA